MSNPLLWISGHAGRKGSRAGHLDQVKDQKVPCNNNSTAPWSPAMLFSTSLFQSSSLPLSIFPSSILLISACIKRSWIHWKKGHGRHWICLSAWEMLACVVLISSSPLPLTRGVLWEGKKIFFLPLASSLVLFRIKWDKNRRDVLNTGVLPSYCPLNHSLPLHLSTIKATELLRLEKTFKIIEPNCSPSTAKATTNPRPQVPHPRVFERSQECWFHHFPGQDSNILLFAVSERRPNSCPPSPTDTW